MPLPEALIRSLRGLPGFDEQSFVDVHGAGQSGRSIRINPAKRHPEALSELREGWPLEDGGFPDVKSVPWWEGGYVLQPRPSFTMDPIFHSGAYYVQESSSMFLGYALRQLLKDGSGLRCLDLCAAPGGKTTQLASLSQISFLLGNETVRGRLPVLYENVVKWGSPHVLLSSEDPSSIGRLGGFFDVMVVDAPCSGSGLFRRDPAAVAEWSPEHVQLCSRRQRRILSDALPALAEGGLLLYSTCSYSREEDEDITDWLVTEMGMRSERIHIPPDWGIVESVSERTGSFGYRFYPDRVDGEGFFLACLRSSGGASRQSLFKQAKGRAQKQRDLGIGEWVRDADSLSLDVKGDEVIAFPSELEYDLQTIKGHFSLRKSGTRIGRSIRGRLLPDHELAMSTLRHPDIPSVELDRADALRYLSKEDVFPESARKGWNLATHRSQALGFLNRLPNRANNAYPAEWRIRARREG